MNHSGKANSSNLCVAALLVFGALGHTRAARASSSYPPVLSAALAAQFNQPFCVPQCTACHVTTQGGPRMLNPFGQNLKDNAGLMGGSQNELVTAAIPKYFSLTPPATALQTPDTHEFDSDGDGVSDRMELLAGDSPSVALPLGQGQFCPDIKYGCTGGRIAAAAPPRGLFGLLASGSAFAAFAVWRRCARRSSRQSRAKIA